MRLRSMMLVTLVIPALLVCARPLYAGGDWNDDGVSWQAYEKGLQAAKADKKPICLIFYTEWCPHCANYSKVFHDPKVVEQAKRFVMIRLDKDKNPDLSKRYAPDGEYIPRTFFLSSAGELAADIHAPRDQFKYFYNESSPGDVLNGMDTALKKLK